MFAAAGIEQGVCGRQVGQGCATSLANEIEIEDIRAQAEAFADVAREAGTEIASTGADDEGVDLLAIGPGIGEGAFSGLCREQRGVFHVAGMEDIGSDIESFIDTVENKVARDDAVVAGKNFLNDGARAGVKLTAKVGG